LRLAEHLPGHFLNDADDILSLDQQIPPAGGEGLSAHDFRHAGCLEDGGRLAEGTGAGILPHEREDQVVVGIENLDGQFLVPGLEDMERQEGLWEEHDLGQGEEGENGW